MIILKKAFMLSKILYAMNALYCIICSLKTISLIPINEANCYVHIKSKGSLVEKDCTVE